MYAMEVQQFYTILQQLNTESSWKKREEILRETVLHREDWKPATILLAGQRFDNNGVAPKRACKSLYKAFPSVFTSVEEVTEKYNKSGKVTDMLIEIQEDLPKPEKKNASVQEIYQSLERLQHKSGDDLLTNLAQIFRMYLPPVVSYGVLNDYSIGVKNKTIKNAIARPVLSKNELERKRGLTYDAVDFVEDFKSDSLQNSPEPGVPFKPMAAKNKSVPNEEKWVGQYKIDGYRLLIHITEDSVRGFTRNLNEESQSIPELQDVDWNDGEYIFDCEAIAYSEDGEPLGFKKTSERIGRKHNILGSNTQIKFKVFDVIYANGDVSQKPYIERFNMLNDVCPINDEHIDILPLYEDISEALEVAEEKDLEGIIAKDKTAPYIFNRSGQWRKSKVTEETIDLRIVGFEQEYKSGGEETLGSIELETKNGVSVGHVGTGLSDEQRKEIWENQSDYYGEIIEVQFEGFDEKLRFPSFKRFRDDTEADSLERIQNIVS